MGSTYFQYRIQAAFCFSAVAHAVVLLLILNNGNELNSNENRIRADSSPFVLNLEIQLGSAPRKQFDKVHNNVTVDPQNFIARDPKKNPTNNPSNKLLQSSPSGEIPPAFVSESAVKFNSAPAGIENKNPRPEYPYLARVRRLEGTTILKFKILEDGRTDSVEVLKTSGSSILDESAVHAEKLSRYQPGFPTETTKSVVFQLRRK